MSPFKLAAGLGLSALLCTSALAQAPAAQAPAQAAPAPAARPPMPPATQPVARDDARHKTFVWQAEKGNIDLLFVGDSITDWWRTPGRGLSEFEKNFGQYKTANWGIAGDTTQGVLWRMQNGELKGFKAKLIIFMLGTNNIGRNTNEDIAAGDRAIIQEFRKQQPQAKILVLGVFPRGAQAGTPMRANIAEINSHLAKLADNRHVFYMDIGPAFLTPDGTLTTEVMADGLHPTTKGYAMWAAAINDKVRELMR
jgi:lysophospholipase L1-like esterase